jgi:hypothetical protein
MPAPSHADPMAAPAGPPAALRPASLAVPPARAPRRAGAPCQRGRAWPPCSRPCPLHCPGFCHRNPVDNTTPQRLSRGFQGTRPRPSSRRVRLAYAPAPLPPLAPAFGAALPSGARRSGAPAPAPGALCAPLRTPSQPNPGARPSLRPGHIRSICGRLRGSRRALPCKAQHVARTLPVTASADEPQPQCYGNRAATAPGGGGLQGSGRGTAGREEGGCGRRGRAGSLRPF